MDRMKPPAGYEALATFAVPPACPGEPGGVIGRFAEIEARFCRAVRRAAAGKRALARPLLAWTSAEAPRVDPVAVFDRARSIADECLLWRSAGEPFALVGMGSAWSVEPGGPDRFQQAAAAWQSLLQNALAMDVAGACDPAAGPLALGGFAFDPESPTDTVWQGYPRGRLTVPRVAVVRTAGGVRLVIAALLAPDGDLVLEDLGREVHRCLAACAGAIAGGGEMVDGRPEAADLAIDEFPAAEAWRGAVGDTVRAIRDRAFDKVVMARGLRVRAARLDPSAALRSLDRAYPDCALFAVARGGRCFFGATPERLVRLRNGAVDVTALAGSAPRGPTAEDDARLGAALLAGAKDRTEHAIVVESFREALSAVCTTLSVPAGPVVVRLPTIQHLATPIAGVLRRRYTALDLVGRLHPSPAVGGAPRGEALRWIRAREGWDRGWYAGPIGWLDGTGNGEFAVAIRSAVVSGTEARLFAGCGVVAASDAGREYAESCLKLRPVLSALTRGG